MVSHVIITWSDTSSIPHQYPISLPQFIISLSPAATSTTTHSFTIPTELPSSKIKIWALLSPLSHHYQYILTSSSLDSTGFMIKLHTYTMLLSYQNTKTQKQLFDFCRRGFCPFLTFGVHCTPCTPLFLILGPGAKPFAAAQRPAYY